MPQKHDMPQKYRYEEFTWPEIREAVAQNRIFGRAFVVKSEMTLRAISVGTSFEK